jgi:diaminohydroxyphosphoribosylaminopyrimidine deaminase/5-amino-6-(5-phosphoribosylamino)uracil reductase
LFVAPKLVGAEGLSWTGALGLRRMAQALSVGELHVERHGRDLLLRAQLSGARRP